MFHTSMNIVIGSLLSKVLILKWMDSFISSLPKSWVANF